MNYFFHFGLSFCLLSILSSRVHIHKMMGRGNTNSFFSIKSLTFLLLVIFSIIYSFQKKREIILFIRKEK